MVSTRPLLTVAPLPDAAPGGPALGDLPDGPAAARDPVPDLAGPAPTAPVLDGPRPPDALGGDVRTRPSPAPLGTRPDADRLRRGADVCLARAAGGVTPRGVLEGASPDRGPLTGARVAPQRASRVPAVVGDGRPGVAPAGGDSQAEAADPPSLADVVAPEPPRPPADAAFLARVRAALDAHLSDTAFGVAELAAAVGLSPRQLRRKLVALTGEPASRMVRRVRVERAAALLADGVRSVKEVQYMVGFASASGFRSAFGEAYGVAPSAYAEGRGPAVGSRFS